MRLEVTRYLDQHTDMKQFVRLHPMWYRKLARNPQLIYQLKEKTDEFYGRTFAKRMERMSQQLNMVTMLMEMAKVMNQE